VAVAAKVVYVSAQFDAHAEFLSRLAHGSFLRRLTGLDPAARKHEIRASIARARSKLFVRPPR